MQILITGANGFIGKNLLARLEENPGFDTNTFTRSDTTSSLLEMVNNADAIFHLAGVNRPDTVDDFDSGNKMLTELLCKAVKESGKKNHIIFASSVQANLDNHYGRSKKDAEEVLLEFCSQSGCPVSIFRLPNVFGKWCRPEYNSVVATFCHHIANDMPVEIHDASKTLRLVYIDDVVSAFIRRLTSFSSGSAFIDIHPEYTISLSELAETLYRFRKSRDSLLIDGVGKGLQRALYATYLSYLEPENFHFALHGNNDDRGTFVEILKTEHSGQFSFFTAKKGVTRGGHYHHTKNEKFVVVQGKAEFNFRNIDTNQRYSVSVSADKPEIVETIPGWAHDITNIGENELIVFLWANEIFNPERPDTIGVSLDG